MNELPRFWKAQIARQLSDVQLISERCKPEAAIIREASAMFTGIAYGDRGEIPRASIRRGDVAVDAGVRS
jgi:hypothetical protein